MVASGDLRPSANIKCWPVQQQLEADVDPGRGVVRVDASCAATRSTRRPGTGSSTASARVWRCSPRCRRTLRCWSSRAVWQYSHHVLAGLRTHRGPIMVVANWNGTFPGLVGLLNLTASLTKAGVEYSSLWSVDFTDEWALDGLRTWLETGRLVHDVEPCARLPALDAVVEEVALGRALAEQLRREKAIIGIFDEGCMGMYNAIFDDELLNPLGIYKERLSQSALVAEMSRVGDDEAAAVKAWLDDAGLRFDFGTDDEDGADRGAGDQPAEDVHRRPAHRRRLRSRRRRHPVPAGTQGRRPGQRSRRGLAQQRRAAARAQPRRVARAVRRRAAAALQRGRRGGCRRCAGDQPHLEGDGLRPGDDAARRALGRASTAASSCG